MKVFVPLKLVSEANQREHWAVRCKRVLAQQTAVRWAMIAAQVLTKTRGGRVAVTMTRIGGRKMDDDNFRGSFKHVRDAVAKYLGVDDGNEALVTWRYEDKPGGRCKGVEIQLEPLAAVKAARET